MKKTLLILLTPLLLCATAFGDEGMWLPFQISKNIDSMQAEGCQLTADDIYNVNHASLKDAVVIFGGGCTGEIISNQGLLITNHHCGYGSIASLSTVSQNYLEDGFWAKSKSGELPVKGLTVKFLVRMQDVTQEILDSRNKGKKKKRAVKEQELIKKIEETASENGKYLAQVRSFLADNQYILLVYEVFKDVRLVATPPKSLGKYGGNTDNWTWPRHTCDFSVFRVYANASNEPADFDVTNVPYKPKKFLKISLDGVSENNYAMIMGFPGRTNRYETSYGVSSEQEIVGPSVVKARDLRLSIMRKAMKQDKAINLELASEYASISNYWKYYIGQTEQLKRNHVIEQKRKAETEFTQWAKSNRPSVSNLMSDYAKLNANYRPYIKSIIYYREAFGATKLSRTAAAARELYQTLQEKRPKAEDIQKGLEKLKAAREQNLSHFVPSVDRDLFAQMTQLYYEEVPKSQQPDVFKKVIFSQFNKSDLSETFEDFANYTYSHTFLLDEAAFTSFCADPDLNTLENDPAILFAMSFVENYDQQGMIKFVDYQAGKKELDQKYIADLMVKDTGKILYPDANSTMRVTYGTVKGYSPQDAIYYEYETTMDGLLKKYIPGDDEFDLPKGFPALAEKKNFGPYANKDGGLTTCFITNNDITGGNSGSPVLNDKGELIGLAFDGNWEAMSGDISFDKNFKRTIAVDIRFVLWVMDYYGNAKNLIQELEFAR